MRFLWHGHGTNETQALRDALGSQGAEAEAEAAAKAHAHTSQRSGGRVVEESLSSLTRSFGDLYAQHHGVISEPEVRIVALHELREAGWRTPLVPRHG